MIGIVARSIYVFYVRRYDRSYLLDVDVNVILIYHLLISNTYYAYTYLHLRNERSQLFLRFCPHKTLALVSLQSTEHHRGLVILFFEFVLILFYFSTEINLIFLSPIFQFANQFSFGCSLHSEILCIETSHCSASG